jgi:hypothetical protein
VTGVITWRELPIEIVIALISDMFDELSANWSENGERWISVSNPPPVLPRPTVSPASAAPLKAQ